MALKVMLRSSEILTHGQLKRLSEHVYSSSGTTFLDPLMQPFWNWVVTKLPLWLAPNLMTVTGLAINISMMLLLVYFSPDAVQEAPRWSFFLAAVGLFVYQTLDACDGKQARRTGSSSPLGELFDHGCDSLAIVFVTVGYCVAVQLGTHPIWMLYQCFLAIAIFYCAHWQTYVSGNLEFGKMDVTELQWITIIVHLTSAIVGPFIWTIKIPGLSMEVKLIPTIFATAASLVVFYRYFCIIFTNGAGKNGSSVAGTSVLSPFIPIALVIIPTFVIAQKSTVNIYENHPCLYIIAFGMVAAKIINKLVVAHMTKSKVDYLDTSFIGPSMLFLNQYFNTYIDEYIVLWLCLVYASIDFILYSTVVCNQICSHLHIYLFSIQPKLVEASSVKGETTLYQPLLTEEKGFQNAFNDRTSDLISEEHLIPYEQPFLEERQDVEDPNPRSGNMNSNLNS